ncbi:MAG TPA: lipoprotein signal peptidase [Bacteroidia bacterium]|nr:lipoprotein signal peptidase [Bacteroidota bacterium]MBP9790350.1 lipoprotein signal peptidase [Bacteroidia bacterium]MBK7431059.1 lipoprotein signal peptidase [Bacteroidota bacterium]MBK7571037.1 lipoprotein signal peptidase [Bacteroidota bacterium]MBK8586157.1 lipoprotein signal peptidase [Bacteroidota bacterium]
MKRAALIIFLVLFIDQVVKIWIKTHMYLGQEYEITKWFSIHFTENNGMAFGLEFGGSFGKLFLSVFRIVASLGIGWYLLHLIKHKAHKLIITCFALIFAGAIGNIIDSAFYGMLFTDSMEGVARFAPGLGYSNFLHGQVVDMLYFPIVGGRFPDWLPIWGGETFLFFRPIFNIADSSITVGVILLLIFQNKFTSEKTAEEKQKEEELQPQG